MALAVQRPTNVNLWQHYNNTMIITESIAEWLCPLQILPLTLWHPLLPYGYQGTLTLSAERQSARVSKLQMAAISTTSPKNGDGTASPGDGTQDTGCGTPSRLNLITGFRPWHVCPCTLRHGTVWYGVRLSYIVRWSTQRRLSPLRTLEQDPPCRFPSPSFSLPSLSPLP